ncbi:MAG: ABC transporter ATP-binding protein [Anaerolineales bacterium]|jgi:ABC-2 type transport system ATP-binding protein|nr:ABC transporter ATP-binding protein [Anaerolineales bacterium]
MTIITTQNLRRTYETTTGLIRRKKKEITALDGVDLSIPSGEMFGLLGQNGAGKTTITRILSTVLLPTSGSAQIFGLDVVKSVRDIRPRIGLVFGGERGLYWRLSGYDNLQYFADLYRVPPHIARRRIPELLELVGLTDRANERIEGYSRGMKQRLHIARGLIHDPELLFLDEPTIGLDPLAARGLREVIRNLNQQGKTIFLTSHYMFEIDALCDRVAIMNKGKILITDTPSALKKVVANLEVVEVECFGAPEDVIQKIQAHPAVKAVNIERLEQSQLIQIQAPAGAELVKEFLGILEGVQVRKVVTRQPTLEDAYVKLVGDEEKRSKG